MPEESITAMIAKLAEARYTRDDLDEFLQALNELDQASYIRVFNELYAQVIRQAPGTIDPVFQAKLEARLDRLVADEKEKDLLLGVTGVRGNWIQWMAAASIILIVLVGGGYFVFHQKKEVGVTHSGTIATRDVPPGGNRAVLTLAGGQKIILDSAANGVLTQQGNVAVQKSANGQLAYNVLAGPPSAVLYNTLNVPRGGQYQLQLPDGSKVWLNSESSIRYPVFFADKDRQVEVEGEAYFEVAKNASKPFKVTINRGVEVEVLGTSFNINAYDDENSLQTTLLEGSVRISTVRSSPATAMNSNAARQSFVLQPGEQAQVTGVTPGLSGKSGITQMKVVRKVDVNQVVAWKNGLFSFDQADLQTVMRQLARWYDVEVVYEGTIKPRRFWGKMERDLSLSEVLRILKETNVHFIIDGRRLIVKP